MGKLRTALGLMVSLLAVQACSTVAGGTGSVNPVVGAWLVNDVDAPFPYHMYVFNADGTLQQANPDAGDPKTSDSDGKGIWITGGDRIKGRWVEVVADRTTHRFTGRTEVSFDIKVNGDTFSGTETARFYDAGGVLTGGPTAPGRLEGRRITYP